MCWLLDSHSDLSAYNKFLLCQQVLKPMWNYGIQLWGSTNQSNRNMQRFQNKARRGIVNVQWYIRKDNLHKDLDIEIVLRSTLTSPI